MKNRTLAQKILLIFFIVLSIGLVLQYFKLSGFIVVNENWDSTTKLILVPLSLTILIIMVFSDSIQEQHIKKKKHKTNADKYIIFLITPFICYLTAAPLITELLPTLYTKLKGTPYTSYVLIRSKWDVNSDCYRHKYTHKKINSPQFEHNFFLNRLCITNEFQKEIEYPTIMFVSGKESYFGRTVTNFNIFKEGLSPTAYEQYETEAEEYWGN